jgi:hypothetical protein
VSNKLLFAVVGLEMVMGIYASNSVILTILVPITYFAHVVKEFIHTRTHMVKNTRPATNRKT